MRIVAENSPIVGPAADQMPIAEITRKTGVFDPSILQADVLKKGADESIGDFRGKRISDLS